MECVNKLFGKIKSPVTSTIMNYYIATEYEDAVDEFSSVEMCDNYDNYDNCYFNDY